MNTGAGTGLFLGQTNGLRYRGKSNPVKNTRNATSLIKIKSSKQAEWNAMQNVDRNYVIATPVLRMEFENKPERNMLFGARNQSKNASKNELTTKQSTAAILSALAGLGQRLGTIEAAQARGLNVAERTQELAETVQNTTTRTLALAKEINVGVQQTLTISQQTLAVVNKIKSGMGLSGGPASYMMNPWFAMVISYLLHPYLPVSMETIMPLWGILLSGGYVVRTVPQLLRGESPITLSGSLVGTARSLAFSQPHAIFLMFSLSRMWTQDRLGTVDPQAAVLFKDVMQSSDLEPILADGFVNAMQGLQEMNLRSFNVTVPDAPLLDIDELQSRLAAVSDNVYNEIVAMNPELWKDKAGCIQLVTEYLGGKLVLAAGGIVHKLGAPGHLYQINTLQRAELYLIECVFNLTKQIFYETGKKLINYTQGYICTALCAFAAVKPASSGFFSSSWIPSPTSILQKSTEYIASFVCDCGKLKMDGGDAPLAVPSNQPVQSYKLNIKNKRKTRNNNAAKRNKTRRNNSAIKNFAAKFSSDHIAFVKLSFNYMMLNMAPFFRIPLDTKNQSYKSLEQEMAKLFVHKLETGQFVPPFYFEDFNILSAYPRDVKKLV